MNIDDVIQFITNRLTFLRNEKELHFKNGDMGNHNRIEKEEVETEETLNIILNAEKEKK